MAKCNFIKALKKEYRDKKIYIWNINRTAGVLWLDLGLKQINIAGFVVYDEDYPENKEDRSIFNRPIVKLSDLKNIEGAILTAEKFVASLDFDRLPSNVKFVRQEDLFEFNEELTQKSVYIYGAGDGANKLSKLLLDNKANLQGFLVSDAPSVAKFHGFAVKKYDKADFNENDAILVGVLNPIYEKEITNILQDFPGCVYVDSLVSTNWKNNTILHQLLYKAQKDKRKIYICGGDDMKLPLLYGFLKTYGYEVEGRVSLCESADPEVYDIYSLCEGDVRDKAVIVNERDKKKLYETVATLNRIGFTCDIPNMDGLQLCAENLKVIGGEHKSDKDALLDGVPYFDGGKEKVWKVLRPSGKSELSIMIVGGSTSTEEFYYPETWMKKLHKKLTAKGVASTIYVGGSPGRHVTPELLIFLRDGYAVKPDIVISMSGLNNTNSKLKDDDPYLNQFNINNVYRPDLEHKAYMGYPIEEDVFDFWLRVERMIGLYAEHIGAKFFPFLQPINLYKKKMSAYDKLQFQLEEHIAGGKLFYDRARDDDFYINLVGLFQNERGTHFDSAHYTDKGAELLSDKVLFHIMPTVKEIVGKL